jgi:hypothetical protein
MRNIEATTGRAVILRRLGLHDPVRHTPGTEAFRRVGMEVVTAHRVAGDFYDRDSDCRGEVHRTTVASAKQRATREHSCCLPDGRTVRQVDDVAADPSKLLPPTFVAGSSNDDQACSPIYKPVTNLHIPLNRPNPPRASSARTQSDQRLSTRRRQHLARDTLILIGKPEL